jgi:rhodanese-related sulfurtransferase
MDVNKIVKDFSSLPQDKKIYVICESGGRSSFSQVFLKAKGLNVVNVFDGMSAYQKL